MLFRTCLFMMFILGKSSKKQHAAEEHDFVLLEPSDKEKYEQRLLPYKIKIAAIENANNELKSLVEANQIKLQNHETEIRILKKLNFDMERQKEKQNEDLNALSERLENLENSYSRLPTRFEAVKSELENQMQDTKDNIATEIQESSNHLRVEFKENFGNQFGNVRKIISKRVHGGWSPYSTNGITQKFSLDDVIVPEDCKVQIFSSISGGNTWGLGGLTSIYNLTHKGFQVFLHWENVAQITLLDWSKLYDFDFLVVITHV